MKLPQFRLKTLVKVVVVVNLAAAMAWGNWRWSESKQKERVEWTPAKVESSLRMYRKMVDGESLSEELFESRLTTTEDWEIGRLANGELDLFWILRFRFRVAGRRLIWVLVSILLCF